MTLMINNNKYVLMTIISDICICIIETDNFSQECELNIMQKFCSKE